MSEPMFLVLCCGGRDFNFEPLVYDTMNELYEQHGKAMRVIEGGARGADKIVREWCATADVQCVTIPAAWDMYGQAAGPIRNQAMLDQRPSLVVAFPGGRGTADMVRRAKRAGVDILEVSRD